MDKNFKRVAKVQLKLRNREMKFKTFPCHIPVNDRVDTKDLINNEFSTSLIECEEEFNITYFKITDLKNYLLISFKENGHINNIFSTRSTPSNSYQIIARAKSFLLIPESEIQSGNFIIYMGILRINFINNKMKFKKLREGWRWWHVFSWKTRYVGQKRFSKIEENRIPLFKGVKYGFIPSMHSLPDFKNGEKIIAIGSNYYKISPPDYTLHSLDYDASTMVSKRPLKSGIGITRGVDRLEED